MNDDSVWLPIYPPPEEGQQKPGLPSPQRQPFWSTFPSHPAFTLSTHIIPAAFLRSSPEIDLPTPPDASLSKKTRQQHLEMGVMRLWELRREDNYRRGQENVQTSFERRLWICLNRYVRRNLESGIRRRKGLTLCCAHANGFNKEV